MLILANWKRDRQPKDSGFNASNCARRQKFRGSYWMHFILLGANLLWAWLRTNRSGFSAHLTVLNPPWNIRTSCSFPLGSGRSNTLRAHPPSVLRGYVPAEQGITPADFLLFSLTAECNIAGRDWGRRTYKLIPVNPSPSRHRETLRYLFPQINDSITAGWKRKGPAA